MAKNILKEAIADAKAVREVALANAKAALEEAFTPRLQSMLSAKLSEELNEEEDLEENVEEIEEGNYYEDDPKADKKMEEISMEEGESADLDEEIDLEEILNELELEEGDDLEEEKVEEAKKDDDEKMEEAKDKDEKTMDEAKDKEDDMNEAKDDEIDEAVGYPNYRADQIQKVKHDATDINQGLNEGEEFDLDALLEEINNLDESNEDDVNEEMKKDKDDKMEEAKDKDLDEAKDEDLEETVNPLAAELEETKEALETVRTELNEVNLLNSKLLYVNRIFKANNLNEAQKLRVVETLDNASNVKEAKLIYETIKDTFTISKETKTAPKKSIRENLGMASKAAGTSTAPKKPVLNESNDMMARMQKLANIKINQ